MRSPTQLARFALAGAAAASTWCGQASSAGWSGGWRASASWAP